MNWFNEPDQWYPDQCICGSVCEWGSDQCYSCNFKTPTFVAAICDGGLFPVCIYDDSIFVRGFDSLLIWRLSKEF